MGPAEHRVRLVFVTQLLDEADPVLGFVVRQLEVLGAKCDLTVIANEVRLSSEARRSLELVVARIVSLGKERGLGTTRRSLAYLREIRRLSRGNRPDALLAHMCPAYLNLAWPLLRLAGIRPLLWFVHPERRPSLRLAGRLAHQVLTAFTDSCPLQGAKVHAIGHAIDTDSFAPQPSRDGPAGAIEAIALGRTSPVKEYPVVITAIAAARRRGVDVGLSIIGPSITPGEQSHREALARQIDDLALGDAVQLVGGVARTELPARLGAADVLISATGPGSADKAVFEAMAAARPVLVASPSFAELLADLPVDLGFRTGDAGSLCDRLTAVAATSHAVRNDIGAELRRRVVAHHSLEGWADAVIAASSKS